MINAARVGGSTPSYTQALTVLGQYCNQQQARAITLAEVETGFLLHFFPKGQWKKAMAVDIHHADLLELTGAVAGNTSDRNGALLHGGTTLNKKHPLLPMGYDVFLRALGVKLDRRAVIGLSISETADKLYVNYWVDKATFMIREGRRQAVSNEYTEIYDVAGVKALIRESEQSLAEEASRYEQSMRLNQHDHITALSAAFMFENDGKYREAEGLFTRVASQVPKHPEAHYHVARLALLRGDRRAALQASRKAVSIVDDVAAVHDLHARILRQNNKLKEAIPAFERAVALDPDNFILRYHLAQAYEAAGRKDDAARLTLSAGHEVAPDWEMVREEMEAEVAAQPPVAVAAQQAAPPLAPSITADEMYAAGEEQGADTLGIPAMITPLSATSEQWSPAPTPLSAQSDLASIAMPNAALPKLTVFDHGAVTEDWMQTLPVEPEEQQLMKPMTLEERLRAAGNFPEAEPASPRSLPGAEEPAAQPTVAMDWPAAATQLPGPPSTPATSASSPADTLPFDPAASLSARLSAASAMPGHLPGSHVAPEASQPTTVAPPGSSPRVIQPPIAPATPSAGYGSAAIPPASQAAPPMAGSPNSVELAAEILMIQRALDAEPNRADLHRKLGFLLARQGKTAEAATEFRKALQASRTNL